MNYRQPFQGSYRITQYYGETITSSFHTGIDYACPMNTPIFASADGVIRFSSLDKTGYGNCVIIEHDVTHATLYAHLNSLVYYVYKISNQGLVSVKQGDLIGYSGTTGYSTGPHLHFEARRAWNDYRSHFNPMDLPLMSVDDSIQNGAVDLGLKEPSELSEKVKIVAPAGAFAHNYDFSDKKLFAPGSEFKFTGNTIEKNGYTFCECFQPYWIAVHDGETQILDNQ